MAGVSIPGLPLGLTGKSIPFMGFGTATSPVESNTTKEAILEAIKVGYRHFDTAAAYQTEKFVGEAIAEALSLGLLKSRDELFITSTLWPTDAHHDRVLPAIKNSLNKMGLEYLDLYLIHWPVALKGRGNPDFTFDKNDLVPMDFKSVWEAMEECQKLGLTKSIGVGNFSSEKLDDLLAGAKISLAVNQVEMSPAWRQKKISEFCEEKGILVAGYSPLGAKGKDWGTKKVMDSEVLQEIANAKGKTVAKAQFKSCSILRKFPPNCPEMAPTSAITTNTEPSKVTDFVLNKGFGVKGLSESGLRSLPKEYIQPIEERIITVNEVAHGESIPIIDMSKWDDPKMADSICDAAEKWGFFQIVNHGVPIEVLESVQEATCRFFGLPAEEKNAHSKENSGSNNVRYGTSFTPEAEKALEWKDYLSLFYVSDDEASALWPAACRDEVLEYMKKTETVIKRLLRVLVKRLNVIEIDIEKENLLMGSKRINLNYYPICPNPELTVGVGRHSDVSTLTILLQDEIGGLYVRVEESDNWIHVHPIKGSLVINIGDALQIMSNGRYKSVEHRVAANGKSDRISVPIFVNPRPSDMISPFPEVFANGQGTAIYKQVLYSDYVKHFFRKAHDGKRTVDFAKI